MSMLVGGLQRSPLMRSHNISQPTAEITELTAEVVLLHTALDTTAVDALISSLFSALMLNSSSMIEALSARLNLSSDAGTGAGPQTHAVLIRVSPCVKRGQT